MKVKELIEKLSAMPQDMDVWMQVYDDCTYTVKNCDLIEFRNKKIVQIDNYVE